MKATLVIGALSVAVFVSTAYAAENTGPANGQTTGPITDEKVTGTTEAAPSPSDALKAGMNPACKEILANQPKHAKDEIEKCGKPSE
jgi:hypothetical protein